jgi:TPP-dependent pyruvate/acetoin dehydrogenase alpha subunit
MDVRAVEAASREAACEVRSGRGPFLLEAKTYRFRAHSMYDAELYRSKAEVEEWKRRDPLALLARSLDGKSRWDAAETSRIEADVREEVDDAVAFAEAAPWEPVADLARDVYTEPPPCTV